MYEEENKNIIQDEQNQEPTFEPAPEQISTQTQEESSEEGAAESSVENTAQPVNPYKQMSEEDYKNSIKQMKLEYKQFQKEKKQAEKQEIYSQTESYPQKGTSTITSILISVVSSVVVFSMIFALLAFFPSKDKSFLASFYNTTNSSSHNGATQKPTGSNNPLGDSSVSKGDDVTINVTGQSGIAQAVYAKAANSVVGIEVSQIIGNKWNKYEKTVSMGSGIIYSSDGIIVTNHHVIEAAIDSSTGKLSSAFSVKIYFTTDLTQWSYVTELIGYDADNDLAVLRVDATDLQPIEFADSDQLTTGETAISLGSPGGLEYMNSISEGILSGLNRTVTTNTSVIYDLIQTTAAINPGNSGGALLNSEGKLIGICVIKIASTEYESMGFAINSNTVKTIVESIKTYGYYNRPLLGVTINTTYSYSIATEKGWPAGAYIEEISGNAAKKAGLKTEDIITKMNDTSISSFLELRRFMLKCNPGDTIKLEVYRISSGETLTFEIKLDGTTK